MKVISDKICFNRTENPFNLISLVIRVQIESRCIGLWHCKYSIEFILTGCKLNQFRASIRFLIEYQSLLITKNEYAQVILNAEFKCYLRSVRVSNRFCPLRSRKLLY